MQASLRPYATAGVALVGASVIAVAPIAPTPAAIQVANPATQLTASSMPLDSLTDLVDNTVDNFGAVADRFLDDPAPIAGAILTTQLSYVAALIAAGGQTATNYANFFADLPETVASVLDDLAAGNIGDALLTVQDAGLTFALSAAPLLLAPVAIVNNTVQNVARVSQVLADSAVGVGLALLAPGIAVGAANADIAQGLFDAVTELDLVTAATILGAAPFEVADAFLNGFDDTTPGLLNGTIPALLDLRDDVADAIEPLPSDDNDLAASDAATATTESAQRFTIQLPSIGQGGATGGGLLTRAEENEGDDAGKAKAKDPIIDLSSKTANGGTDLSDGNSATSSSKKSATANKPGKRVQEAVQGATTQVRNTVNNFGERVRDTLNRDDDDDSGQSADDSASSDSDSE